MSNSIDRTIISVNAIDRNNTEQPQKLQKFWQFQLNYKTRVFLPGKTVTQILTRSKQKILPVPESGEMLWTIYFLELLQYFETDKKTG
ncbi:MAG: hypothetical protein ACFBSE_12460 [Prochloraceae cyanobacterium]